MFGMKKAVAAPNGGQNLAAAIRAIAQKHEKNQFFAKVSGSEPWAVAVNDLIDRVTEEIA